MDDITLKIVAGEKRLTMLLVGHWQGTRGERECPLAADFYSAVPAGLLADCFIYLPDEQGGAGQVCDIGSKIGRESGIEAASLAREDVPEDTLMGVACQWLDAALERRAPVFDSGEARLADGEPFLYRSTLLPLEDETGRIVQVLGGARCKVQPTAAP